MIDPMTFGIIVICGLAANQLKPDFQPPRRRFAFFGKLILWGVLFSLIIPTAIPWTLVLVGTAGTAAVDLAGDWVGHIWQRQAVKREPTSQMAYQRIRREIG